MLTHDQADRIIGIINTDAEIRHEYQDAHGRTCALGGLARAAHIRLPAQEVFNQDNERLNELGILAVSLQELATELSRVYGLSRNELNWLQRINDQSAYLQSVDPVASRRQALCNYVQSLVQP